MGVSDTVGVVDIHITLLLTETIIEIYVRTQNIGGGGRGNKI